MSSLDLNFNNQVGPIDVMKSGEEQSLRDRLSNINKVLKKQHSLAFPSAANTRFNFHEDSDDSLYDL